MAKQGYCSLWSHFKDSLKSSQSSLVCFRWWTAPCLWLVSMWRRTSSSSRIWSSTRWPLLCLASPLLSSPMPRCPSNKRYWLISGTVHKIHIELVISNMFKHSFHRSSGHHPLKWLLTSSTGTWISENLYREIDKIVNMSLCLWDRHSLVHRQLSRDELKVSYWIKRSFLGKGKYDVSSNHKHKKTRITNVFWDTRS